MKRIFLLIMISSLTLSSSKIFDFKNSKKVKVELSSNIHSESYSSDNEQIRYSKDFNGSVTLYEFLKLSGGIGLNKLNDKVSLNTLETWLSFGLNFKEFGNSELKLEYNKIRFKYEYNKKIKDLGINVKGGYSSFYVDYNLGVSNSQKQKENRYELDTKLKYDFGKNFTLVSDFGLWLSMWHSNTNGRLIPYYLLIGTGVDYKNDLLKGEDYKGTLISGIYSNYYSKRNQNITVNSNNMSNSSGGSNDNVTYAIETGYYNGFVVETYIGYEFEKKLGNDSSISVLGKLSAYLDNRYEIKKAAQNNEGIQYRMDAELTPRIKLEYKFNNRISIDMEYFSSIGFIDTGYIGTSNRIRTGVKYTWEK